VATQLAALVLVLAGMGGVALYLSRPPTADELYRTITARGTTTDEATLANTEREIREFLQRYPSDPRAAEISRYHEQIELDKAERRLQREARGGNFVPTQLPAERLYLQAVQTAATDPDAALSMLESIVDLYADDDRTHVGSSGANQTDQARVDRVERPRVSVVVELAKRRIVSLRKDISKQRDAQLVDIRERLETAAAFGQREPQKAVAIYRAIVDLHEREPWAAEAVAEARNRLKKLALTNDERQMTTQ
jgi:hypothetical protein